MEKTASIDADDTALQKTLKAVLGPRDGWTTPVPVAVIYTGPVAQHTYSNILDNVVDAAPELMKHISCGGSFAGPQSLVEAVDFISRHTACLRVEVIASLPLSIHLLPNG